MTHSTDNPTLNRRKALLSSTGMLAAGSALALGATSGAQATAREDRNLVLDIAARFSTFRISLPDGFNERDRNFLPVLAARRRQLLPDPGC